MRSRCSARIRMRVCGCTPSTAESTSTAPSSTLSTRSTSAMKSGWPGVSIRLTCTSFSANDATADLIVMPRCRSSASESVCVVPASTLPSSVDGAGLVQQPFGESCLTGVYMRQDPKVELFLSPRVIPSE